MCAAITSAAIGTGLSAFQAYQGYQDKKDAKNALNNFKRQDLGNPYENMQLSTVGTDAMREESGRTAANLVDASRGDIRSVMGNIPRIVSINNDMNRAVATELDTQNQKRDYAIANQRVNNQGMQEQRDNADLSGIGNQMNVGRQDMWNGLRGLMASANYGINNISSKDSTPKVDGVSPITPVGVVPYSANNNSLPPLSNPTNNGQNFGDFWNNNFYGF